MGEMEIVSSSLWFLRRTERITHQYEKQKKQLKELQVEWLAAVKFARSSHIFQLNINLETVSLGKHILWDFHLNLNTPEHDATTMGE